MTNLLTPRFNREPQPGAQSNSLSRSRKCRRKSPVRILYPAKGWSRSFAKES